jgi:hypothetical protein
MITELFFSPGTISLIRENNWLINCFDIGKYGISVKIKIRVGGIAITILKEIPLALSVRLVLFNCWKNECQTSKSENPFNPGKKVFLLRLMMVFPGLEFENFLLMAALIAIT